MADPRPQDNALDAPPEYLQSGEDVHVYPIFGPPHIMWDRCWCHPERDGLVVIHNTVH